MDCLSRRHSGKRERVPCDSRQNGRIVVAEGRRADEKNDSVLCPAALGHAGTIVRPGLPEGRRDESRNRSGGGRTVLAGTQGRPAGSFRRHGGRHGAIMGGLSSGLREGAKDAQAQLDGADGVTLIRNAEELTSAVNVSVLSAEKPAEKSWRIFLAFRNQRDFPVRLTSLTRKQNVLLQDAEGFVYELAAGENAQRVITIPAQAAVKVPFDFVRVDAVPRSIRLYGKDIPFPDGL